MPFTLAQQTALAVVPKITGFASMFFSSLIVYYVVRNKKKRNQTYHRLLAAISICDLSASFWLALSTWPIPKESGLLWAVGNDMTCNVQGFFTQFGISSSFYNASISIYYLLVIKHGWKEADMQRYYLQYILHVIPLSWSLGTAISGLFIGIFGNASLWCWISHTANIYRWTFFYGPLWCMILIVTVNCILIYRHVQKLERAVAKYRYNNYYYNDATRSGNSGVSGDYAQRLDGQRLHESTVERQQQQQQQQQQQHQQQESQEIILNSRDVEAIADSLINEEEDDDDDHHEGGDDDDVGGGDKDADDSSKDDEKDLEQNQVNPVVRVGSTVPAVTNTAVTVATLATTAAPQRSNSMLQRRNTRVCKQARQRQRKKNRQTREVAKQSFLYAGAFYINWCALTLTRILQTANGKVYFPLLLIAAMTTPMQGLPNFLVYLRPRFQRKGLQRQRQRSQRQQHIDNTATAAAAAAPPSPRRQSSVPQLQSSQLTRQSSLQKSSKSFRNPSSLAVSPPCTPNSKQQPAIIVVTPVTTSSLTLASAPASLPCPPLTDIQNPNDATATTTTSIEMTTISNNNDDKSANKCTS